MKYIYDIYLNFNNELYEFYDWNKSDKIIHIKKIPIFKVQHEKLKDIYINQVIFPLDFLDLIKNKTETFSRQNKYMEYAFLITDGISIIALKIDNNIKYSSLLISEELDILEQLHMDDIILKYKIKKPNKNILLKTRYQLEQEQKIKKNLNSIIKNKEYSKLKYIYYECFNKKEDNVQRIMEQLNEFQVNKVLFNKLLDFFNLSKQLNNLY